jgi:hypothetical protein
MKLDWMTTQVLCPTLASIQRAHDLRSILAHLRQLRAEGQMHELILLLFAVVAGGTASGLVTAGYRLVAATPQTRIAILIYWIVMIVAGPVILIENSTRAFYKETCTVADYSQALALSVFWSLTTGLLLLLVYLAV